MKSLFDHLRPESMPTVRQHKIFLRDVNVYAFCNVPFMLGISVTFLAFCCGATPALTSRRSEILPVGRFQRCATPPRVSVPLSGVLECDLLYYKLFPFYFFFAIRLVHSKSF